MKNKHKSLYNDFLNVSNNSPVVSPKCCEHSLHLQLSRSAVSATSNWASLSPLIHSPDHIITESIHLIFITIIFLCRATRFQLSPAHHFWWWFVLTSYAKCELVFRAMKYYIHLFTKLPRNIDRISPLLDI